MERLSGRALKIVVTGSTDFNNHRAIWNPLDKAQARHLNMTLIHGGSLKIPGSGIQHNLADKARKLGIPVWRVACTA